MDIPYQSCGLDTVAPAAAHSVIWYSSRLAGFTCLWTRAIIFDSAVEDTWLHGHARYIERLHSRRGLVLALPDQPLLPSEMVLCHAPYGGACLAWA